MINMKEMPNNIQAEKELLSWIMEDMEDLSMVAGKLKAEDFYLDRHRIIYNAICGLYALGKTINQISLIEALGEEAAKKISITYIAGLVNESIRINAKELVEIIEEKSYRRKIIKESQRAMQEAMNDKNDVSEVATELQNSLLKTSSAKQVVSDNEVMNLALDEILERYKNNGRLPGMKSGFKSFDMHTKGFSKGKLVVLGAEPGMGKSLVSLNLAEGLTANGYKILYFSIEMDEKECGIRRMASQTMIDMKYIEFGKLSDNDWQRLVQYSDKKSKEDNFYMDCSEYQNLNTIVSKIKSMKMTKGLDIVFIDHIGLIDIGEIYDAGRRSEAIGNISRRLKMLAKELDICIVALSQLSTGDMKGRADKRPMAYDLAGSKRIREDADMVIFCYRDIVYNEEANPEELEIIIRKFRGGQPGTIKMIGKLNYQKLIDPMNI